ncbi:MAG: FecR domain-containing protein [Bacteroidetes bacterium]|nr:FecR domain-containing protein [Bacteroidota bacterium]
MELNNTYYTDLICRYFSGEVKGEENDTLITWIEADPSNLKLFREYQATWEILQKSGIESLTDIDAEWAEFEKKMDESEKLSVRISPVHSKFTDRKLSRHDSHHILQYNFTYSRVIRIAAVILLILLPSFFLYRYFTRPEALRIHGSGEIVENRLPDGTSVTLNTAAILEYPSRFTGNYRDVSLSGEAWFEVAHDKTKPFIISNGRVRIEVLGTSFYVNTKSPDGTIELILSTGKVSVYYADTPSEPVILLPGQKAEISANTRRISLATNEYQNFLSWKTKVLYFNDDPMANIIRDLNKVYHSSIEIKNKRLSACRITATFDKQSLSSILNVLKSTLDFQIKNTGSSIELTGEGCN